VHKPYSIERAEREGAGRYESHCRSASDWDGRGLKSSNMCARGNVGAAIRRLCQRRPGRFADGRAWVGVCRLFRSAQVGLSRALVRYQKRGK